MLISTLLSRTGHLSPMALRCGSSHQRRFDLNQRTGKENGANAKP
jgi:hypothetical protein